VLSSETPLPHQIHVENTVETSITDVYKLFQMNEAALISAFELLDDFLTSGKSAPVWLVVGGGSALLVQRLSTRQTKDVDVMALREWEGNIVSAYPVETSTHPKLPSLLHELGHADLIPGFS
jgi:hypothetical protein